VSYDLAVFDPAAAPGDDAAFVAWYRHQTTWSEPHGYDDPQVSTPALRAWFEEMIKAFPPMNGPLASADAGDPMTTDYSVGRTLIYAAFAWSVAAQAHEAMRRLAEVHGVGFFDVSGDGEVWRPPPR
jgi:hypothetical protein